MFDYTNYTDYYSYYYYEENATDFVKLNFSEPPDCPGSHLHGSNIYLPVLYYLVYFTGFFGNLFVISVVWSKGRRSGDLVDTFVVNLALADLVFISALPPLATSASQNGLWNFGRISDLLCKLSSFIIAVNCFSKMFFLSCMSVDRYLAVVKLRDSGYLRSSRSILATCLGVWMSSVVLAIPSLVYRKAQPIGDGFSCLEDDTSTLFLSLGLVMPLLTFILLVLVIILCYGTIVAHLNQHCAANSRAQARRRHSLKMVLSIIVVFVVSWLPFNIFKTIIIMSQLSNADTSCLTWQKNGLLISGCLAFFNSCINPAIYFFMDRHFRRRAKFLLATCVGKSKSQQSHNSSASFTNNGSSESCGGRTQLQVFD